MIDKDKLHAFLFATLYPNETSDDGRYDGSFHKIARDKAYEEATELTDYYVERSELEEVLPKGVGLPQFKYELQKFFDEEILFAEKDGVPTSMAMMGRPSRLYRYVITPIEGRIVTLWKHLHFKPESGNLIENLNNFYKAFFTKENIRALYDALHGLKYIKL